MYNTIVLIKDTHRGLWYEDGVLVRVVGAGRHELPPEHKWFKRQPKVELVLVDMRERDLTIKGQEILTSDKVALRVSILVQFRIINPQLAMHAVTDYLERLYSDVQLAARRSLASMNLEEILTNRNRLSEDILTEVKESAATYGVSIGRADVKDLVFPGNLQEIMNRVLAAERNSQAQLVEARTKAELQRIEAQTRAEAQRLETEVRTQAELKQAQSQADAHRVKTEAEVAALQALEQAAKAYAEYPALLRLQELETLRELSKSANAKIFVNFDHEIHGEAN